ncbi:metal ABC transporter permease [Ferrimonas balearica]|uniref:metal ABC transporter permease n=1 Tax=Ferrimonas balearica TaxID=44012 RepID=UPI001F470BFA|nr:metal ABC transporter permease [Ferrimonas balearica]MBY6016465.1 metal ABC transporter permease [Halomonas denitrificans]MBY6095264.1 metal ABC transporter permease [Ferrimonas balearica]
MEWLRELAANGAAAGYLPESFGYGFLVNALVAALFIGPILGALGTLVIAKRLAFFSEAVGHGALTGVAIGILLGEPTDNPMIGLFCFCMIFALLLHYIRNRTNVPYDTLVGVFLAVALAGGAALLMFVARKINIHLLENVLFGSILTVTDADILLLVVATMLIAVFFVPTFNRMLLTCISPDLARVRGWQTAIYDYLFVVMITLITIAAVKIIGAVLVGALLLIPGATARLLTRDMGAFVRLSALLATLACVLGTLLPMEMGLPIPSGAAIILLSATAFLAATGYRIVVKG